MLHGWYRRFGWPEKAFSLLLLVYIALLMVAPASGWLFLTQVLLIALGIWAALRLTGAGMRRAIWALRNRLLVTYLFIGLVPVLLILTLAGLGIFAVTSEVAIYLVTSELDRRVNSLRFATETLSHVEPSGRPDVMRQLGGFYMARIQDVAFSVRTRSGEIHWPPDAGGLESLPAGWGDVSGIVLRDGGYYAWSHVSQNGAEYTAVSRLSRQFLSSMVPGLGESFFLKESGAEAERTNPDFKPQRFTRDQKEKMPDVIQFPPAVNRFDRDLSWPSVLNVSHWDRPGSMRTAVLLVRTRPSAVLNTVFNRKVDRLQSILFISLLVVAIVFLVVEIISLFIGVSLTRTITSAVHDLYEGTQRVMREDFSHRIPVGGKDQLAELAASFNTMTENLAQLLVVAKEKERLQAEIEIASEVQLQLYPKVVPSLKTMRITANCQPARMVSGDYYDYQCLETDRVALAIGDVAGKGISAALLMATIQSALRMELRSFLTVAAPSGAVRSKAHLSTAQLVSDLNLQLHAHTAAEKFSTFFLGLYDETSGVLTYTNAGHLPPILFRDGSVTRLDVNGMVVGAFAFAQYDQSTAQLRPGDLLLFYTDGITEPENEYGEMFGEERLVEIVSRNTALEDQRIISLVMESVRQWTNSPELHDDMTLLIARRL